MQERTGSMSKLKIPGLTGAVLAGGEARRMGRVNKALVTVGGRPVIDLILDRLNQTCDHVMVIASTPEPYAAWQVPVHPDIMPHHAALGGLYTALSHAPTAHVFVCACDMPFISAPLIRHLAQEMGEADAVVPRDRYGLQPLHALYARRVAPAIRGFLERGDLKMERFIASIDARILPPEDVEPYAAEADIFFNVNTPVDLELARRKAGPAGEP